MRLLRRQSRRRDGGIQAAGAAIPGVKGVAACALLVALSALAWAEPRPGELPYVLKWKRLLGTPVLSSVAAGDSLVYVGSTDGHLYALRSSDATVAWKHRFDAEVCAGPALADSLVIAGGYDGHVYGLNRHTGKVVWEFVAQGGVTTDMIVDGGAVFFGSADYKVYALGAHTGKLLWQCKTRGQVSSTPAVDEQAVYFGSQDDVLRAVSRDDGTLVWKFETKGAINTAPLVAGGRVYFGSDDRHFYALSATDGQPAWKYRVGGKFQADPVVLGGAVHVGATNGFVCALDAASGEVRWKHNCEAEVTGSALAESDSTFFIGTQDGVLHRFNTRTGKPTWSFETHGSVTVRPTRSGQTLWVGSDDGFLYALDLAPEFPPIAELLWEHWYEQYYKDSKTGYIHEVATRDTLEGREAIRLRTEDVEWENGFRRTVSERLVDEDYHLIAFEKQKTEYDQRLRVSGKVMGDSLLVESSLAGHTFSRVVAMPRDAVAPELLERGILRAGIPAVGDTFRLSVFNYATLDQTPIRYAILDTSSLDFEGRPGRYFLGEIEYPEGEMQGIKTQEWVDASGAVLLSETPTFELFAQRVPREEALAWYVPEEAHRTTSDVKIEEPTKLNLLEVRLKLNVPGIGKVFLDDERQHVTVESDTTARILIRRLSDDARSAGELPFKGAELTPYLEPTVYCQSQDPRLIELGHRIIGTETNAWRATKKLVEWVYNNMVATETNVKFNSSVEVLESMEGTCSEYTLLLMGLARAVGLPARVAVGLIPASGNVIGLHMWPEVYVGKWLGVDPSWNEMDINPAHIKITTGTLALEDMLRFDIPLQLALTQLDTVRVIQFDSEEGLRLVEADRLFEEARDAENRFEEDEAIALLKKMGDYPPNSKTDDALISLADIYLRHDKVGEAVAALSAVFEQHPPMEDVDQALYRLAGVRRDREAKPDLALTTLQTLVARYPDSDYADDALCTVGEIYEREFGDLEAAKGAYRQVKEQYADTGWAMAAENALERLEAAGQDSLGDDGGNAK